jgi:hypothetical protein
MIFLIPLEERKKAAPDKACKPVPGTISDFWHHFTTGAWHHFTTGAWHLSQPVPGTFHNRCLAPFHNYGFDNIIHCTAVEKSL